VHPSRLAFYDPWMRFVTEPGAFTISAGSSSASIRAEKTVILDGPVAEYRQSEIVAQQRQMSPILDVQNHHRSASSPMKGFASMQLGKMQYNNSTEGGATDDHCTIRINQ
jgi:hypothetical protein